MPILTKKVSSSDLVPGHWLCLCARLPVCLFRSLTRPSSFGSLSLSAHDVRALRGPRQLRALPATCPRDSPGLGEGAPTLSGRALVQARSRPHLAGGRHGQDRTGQGTPAPPSKPGREARRRSAQGSPRPGPASPPGFAEETACPAHTRGPRRYLLRAEVPAQAAGTSGVLCHGRGGSGGASVRPSHGGSVAALQRPETPGPPLAPPGWTPGPVSPAGLRSGAACRETGRERASGRAFALPTCATRQGLPYTALCPHPSPAQLPSHMCSLHRSCPNAAWLPAEDVWARDCTFNLA